MIVSATPLWFYALGGTSHPAASRWPAAALDRGDRRRARVHGRPAAGIVIDAARTRRWRSHRGCLPSRRGSGEGQAAGAPGGWDRRSRGAREPLSTRDLYGRPAAAHLLHAIKGTLFPDSPSARDGRAPAAVLAGTRARRRHRLLARRPQS
ncbi:MAG: hypothetical protein MZU84_04080 [Sphingobacterium sp.]|nr:hypothetical protein [Sphingobacterium sp.]